MSHDQKIISLPEFSKNITFSASNKYKATLFLTVFCGFFEFFKTKIRFFRFNDTEKKLSDFEKGKTDAFHQQDKSNRQIAEILGRFHTVYGTKKQSVRPRELRVR